MIRSRLFTLLAGVATCALPGCALLAGRHEDVTTYSLSVDSGAMQEAASEARAWQLTIALPQAISPLDGARMVVMPRTGEMEFYKGARWRDSIPAMIQDLLLQEFHGSGHLSGVAPQGSGARPDFILRSYLQDFQTEYRGAATPTVVERLTAQLIDSANGRIVAARTFAVEESCTSPQLADVFAGFERATQQLLAQLVEWTAEQGDANRQQRNN